MGINFSPCYILPTPNFKDVFTITSLVPNKHPGTSVSRGCSRSQFNRCAVTEAIKAWQPLVGYALLILEASLSHTHTQHPVGLLWTNDRPVAETYTWQTTTFTIYRHPWPRLDSNLQSHQASGRNLRLRLRGNTI